MKKTLIFLFMIFGMGFYAQAQVNPHAFGIRFGGNGTTNSAELSYQQAWGDENRIEMDLGFGFGINHSRLFLTGIYQWNWNLAESINWYAGPAASVGFFTYDGSGYVNIGIGGQIGIEYDLNKHGKPILLSLDARPIWDFLGSHSGLGWGASLGVRYTW